jgi:catechol 2,3-dioxygenase-like lactoylglutathione lyase family enzyme
LTIFHHIDVPVDDLARSREFYSLLLKPLGVTELLHRRNPQGHEVAGFGVAPDPAFWIRSGRPAVRRVHVAFLAKTRAAVDAFHAAGVAAGGASNGEPGLRPHYAEHYYAAYVLDPDGNNIEAVCRVAG